MALTLTLRPKQDVYIGDEQITLVSIDSNYKAVLTTPCGGRTEINPFEWTPVEGVPGAEAMLAASRETNRERNLEEVRVQLTAPGRLILRGEAYRKGKPHDQENQSA
jgi:hypothetical protein